MTGPQPPQPAGEGSSRDSRRVRVVLLSAVAIALLVAAAGIWYIFFRPAGPAPVGSGAPFIPPGAVSSTPAPSIPASSTAPTITLPATTP